MERLQEKLLLEFVSVKENIFFKAVSDSFPNGVFPTKRDVLQRLLHERNWQTRAAAVIVANDLYGRRIHCNVYCISVDGIVFRIFTLVKDC